MMFKTYDSDIEGITNKLGFSKRSFAEWGEQVSSAFTESEGKMNKFKNTLSAVFVPQKDNTQLIGDFQAFKDLMLETGLSAEELAKEVGGVDSRIVSYAKSGEVGKLTTDGFKESIGDLSLGAKAGQVALKGLALVGNALAMAFASWVATEIISWLNNLAHAEENARKHSEELTSSYETEKKNIDDSIAKYKELSEKLNDASLSTSEVKSIKEQLLSVQDQLNEKYGAEATQIDLVNGKYDEQIKKLDKLAKKKAGDYVAENYNDIKADQKYVSEEFNVNKSLGFKGSQARPDDYSNAGFDLKKYLDKYDKLDAKVVNPDGQYGMTGDVNLITSGTRQEVHDQISSLLNELNHDFGESNPDVVALKATLSNILTSSFDTNELAAANDRIKKYAQAEILSNDDASTSYNNLVDAVDNYNTALSSGKGVDDAKQKLLETKQAAEDSTNEISNSGKVLKDVYNSLSNEAPIEFQIEIGKDIDDDLQKSYEDTINRFKNNVTEDQTQQLEDAKQNLEDEYKKISDWGLDDYTDQIKNGTLPSQFGNVDMDNRQIIDWNIDNIEKWKDALSDIKYYDEDGNFIESYYDQLEESAKNGKSCIDTVFGDLMDQIEGYGDITALSFSHVVNNDDGTFEFLGQKTAEEYLYGILDVAKKDGDMSIGHILELDKKGSKNAEVYDAQGKVIGETYIHGIISGFNNDAKDISELTHFAGKFGAVQIAKNEIAELEKQFGKDGSQTIKDFFDTEGINTQEEIDAFNDVTKGITDADEAIKKWTEDKQNSNETPISSFKDAWSGLEKGKDELTKLAEAGRLTANALKGLEGGKTLMEKTGLSAEQLAEKINKLTDSATQLSSLSGQISKMSDMLADKANGKIAEADTLAGFDVEVRGLDSWKEFETVMGSSSSTMEQCQKAANALATEWINDGNFLANLTEKNKEYYTTQLSAMGIANASAIVTDALAKKHRQEALAEQYASAATKYNATQKNVSAKIGTKLANVTASEIATLKKEGLISNDTASQLTALAVKKAMVNGTTLDTSGDIENLAALAGASTELGKALEVLAKLKAGGNGMPANELERQIKEQQERIKKLVDKGSKSNANIKVKIDSTGSSSYTPPKDTSSNKDNSSKTNQKAEKTAQIIDFVERRINKLTKAAEDAKNAIDNMFSRSSKNKQIDKTIAKTNALIKAEQKAAKLYQSYANKAAKTAKKTTKETVSGTGSSSKKIKVKGLSQSTVNKYIKLIENGSLNTKAIKSIKNEKLKTFVQDYQNWYDKSKEALEKVKELQKQQAEYQKQKYQNYVDEANDYISKNDTQIELATTASHKNDIEKNKIKYIKQSYKYQEKIAKQEKDSLKLATLRVQKEKDLLAVRKEILQNSLDENESKRALLDAKLSNATSATAKNKILSDEMKTYDSDYKANQTYYNSSVSNRKSKGKTATTNTNKVTTLSDNDRKKINNYIKQGKKIPKSLLNKVKKTDSSWYNSLTNYNNKYADNSSFSKALKNSKKIDKKTKNTIEKDLKDGKTISKSTLNKLKKTDTSLYKKAIEWNKEKTKRDSVSKKISNTKSLTKTDKNKINSLIKSGKAISSNLMNKVKAANPSLYSDLVNYNNSVEDVKDALNQRDLSKEQTKADKRAKVKEQFDNIQNDYDRKSTFLTQKNNAIANELSIAEARGQVIGQAYYTRQMANLEVDKKDKQKEFTELSKELKNIDFGTDEWYEAQEALNSVGEAIQQDTQAIAEFQKEINQLKFDRFDELINKLGDITDETDFLIDMLDSDNLFDSDTGMISQDGITAMGLTAQNYDTYLAEAQKYKEAIADLNEMYKEGEIDLTDYNSQLRAYQQGQRDSIKSANEAKKSLVAYVKQGLDAQNSALEEAISKKKELLETEKDLHDFQSKISDQNKNIANLRKQISALEGDDSEENRKKLQQLKSDLKDAEKEQSDTLYDRSISDQEDALDKMLENSKKQAEDYLKDTDKVLSDALTYVNANTSQVASNIERIAKETGYNVSSYIVNAWKDGGDAVGDYANTLSSNVPNITAQLKLIESSWQSVCKAADEAAEASAKYAEIKVNETQSGDSNNTNNSGNNDSTSNDSTSNDSTSKDSTSKDSTSKDSTSKDSTSKDSTSKDNSVPDDFIKRFIIGALRPANGKTHYGALNGYLFSMTQKVLSVNDEVELGKLLDVDIKNDLSGNCDRERILNALLKRNIRFAQGGILGDLVKVSGEDGLFIGSRGESVLTKEQTQALINFKPVIPQLNTMFNTFKNIPNANNSQILEPHIEINTTVEGIATDQIVKDFENVATRQAENVVKKINQATYAKGVRR